MATLCPWSSAWVAPVDRVTAIGAGAELAPQPDINTKTNNEYRSAFFMAPSRQEDSVCRLRDLRRSDSRSDQTLQKLDTPLQKNRNALCIAPILFHLVEPPGTW